MKTTLKTLALTALLLPGIASAEMSKEEIAKASQNPLTAMYSLPIQNNTYFDRAGDGKVKNVANFQPVIPFDLNDDWTLVTRTIMPLTSAPAYSGGSYERVFGLGDTSFTAFFTPKDIGKDEWIWGVGPVIYMPTATDGGANLGTEKWGAGPAGIALKMDGKWVYGALLMNIWSFAGPGQSEGIKKVNTMQFQPFVNYNLDDGWFLTTVPIITANWEAEEYHNVWTVPVGAGVGRAMKMGKIPMTAQLHAYYNAVTPDDYGEKWQMRIRVQLLFPR
jgi:hypothetical protein